MSNIQSLIEQSKEAKKIHEDWKLIQADRRKNGLIPIEKVGNVEWHQLWIKYYDEIIEVLEAQTKTLIDFESVICSEVLEFETKIAQAIGLTESEHPYKEAGNRNSYSEYNEGWADCCNILGNRIKELLK